jgi:hypothetical protein
VFRKSLGPGTDSGWQLPRVAAYQLPGPYGPLISGASQPAGRMPDLRPAGTEARTITTHCAGPWRTECPGKKPPSDSGSGIPQGLRDGGTLATLRSLFFSP